MSIHFFLECFAEGQCSLSVEIGNSPTNAISSMSDSNVMIIFLSCKTETLLNRFSITRRPHPMTGEKSLKNSIKKELEIIGPLRDQADFIIDTSSTSPNDLRLKLGAMFSINSKQNIKILKQRKVLMLLRLFFICLAKFMTVGLQITLGFKKVPTQYLK